MTPLSGPWFPHLLMRTDSMPGGCFWMPTCRLPLPKAISLPSSSSTLNEVKFRPLSKEGRLGDLSWLDHPGLSRLVYSRILQGNGFKTCSILQFFNLTTNSSLQRGSLFQLTDFGIGETSHSSTHKVSSPPRQQKSHQATVDRSKMMGLFGQKSSMQIPISFPTDQGQV